MADRNHSETSGRKRVDVLLVERGLFESRARARAAIEAGGVVADGRQVLKASETIAINAELSAQPAHPWVSRGGVKLGGALEQYPIDIEGHVCLDVGASTGGFTEVLLANGASFVFAIDVGRGQLHPSLRGHPRIASMEDTDIRKFEGKRLYEMARQGLSVDRTPRSIVIHRIARVSLAADRGMTLAGFARRGKVNVYAGA